MVALKKSPVLLFSSWRPSTARGPATKSTSWKLLGLLALTIFSQSWCCSATRAFAEGSSSSPETSCQPTEITDLVLVTSWHPFWSFGSPPVDVVRTPPRKRAMASCYGGFTQKDSLKPRISMGMSSQHMLQRRSILVSLNSCSLSLDIYIIST